MTHACIPADSSSARESLRFSAAEVPVNMFAAVMGLSGLAIALRQAHGALGVPSFIGEAVGALAVAVFLVLATAYAVKTAKVPGAVREEFSHPVKGSFFGTIGISILLLSSIVAPHAIDAAVAIWILGMTITFGLTYVSVVRLLEGRLDPSHALPGLIVPCVATLDIPVTSGHVHMSWVAQVDLMACAIGAAMALVLFVLIMGRLIHGAPLSSALTPSLMILVAPFAVGCIAYVNVMGEVDRFAIALFDFGLFMFVAVSPRIFRRSVSFSTGWWAIGFPMAALTNAASRVAQANGSVAMRCLGAALLGILSVLIAGLIFKTLQGMLEGDLFSAPTVSNGIDR